MKAATSLVAGRRAEPALAEAAVQAALAEAGLSRADQVILFLSREFSRHAQPAVLAAARAAGCLSVSGCTASGLLTERGWHLDQPAAAALVLATDDAPPEAAAPVLSYSGHSRLPFAWQAGVVRAGLIDAEAATWSHGRVADDGCAECRLPGLRARVVRSDGLRRIGEPLAVDAGQAFDVQRIGGRTAADSLLRALPAEWRARPPLHQIAALRDVDGPGIAILSINADGSLSLAEALRPGETISWAIRQPLAAEEDIRQALQAVRADFPTAAVDGKKQPNFAIMFSCIGRGPLFYGGEDRDLLAFRDIFPGTPLIGAYGTGQIAPLAAGNRLFQNTALTLLFESAHV